ncbi:MAG: tetratricopeptide repeat protein [Candidatus Omnitrophica bacterium]|nr:tetratricopeptide repeat protein [Candidatus Omnitrophota bacterium]
MISMSKYFWFRVVAFILIFSFIALDITWAYPSEPPDCSTLAIPTPFQEPSVIESFRKISKLLAKSLDLANYVYGDKERNIGSLPREYIGRIFGDAGTYEEADFSRVVVVDQRRQILPNSIKIGTDDILLIPYTVNGQKRIIQIAPKGNSDIKSAPGYELRNVSDRYIVKIVRDDASVPNQAVSIEQEAAAPIRDCFAHGSDEKLTKTPDTNSVRTYSFNLSALSLIIPITLVSAADITLPTFSHYILAALIPIIAGKMISENLHWLMVRHASHYPSIVAAALMFITNAAPILRLPLVCVAVTALFTGNIQLLAYSCFFYGAAIGILGHPHNRLTKINNAIRDVDGLMAPSYYSKAMALEMMRLKYIIRGRYPAVFVKELADNFYDGKESSLVRNYAIEMIIDDVDAKCIPYLKAMLESERTDPGDRGMLKLAINKANSKGKDIGTGKSRKRGRTKWPRSGSIALLAFVTPLEHLVGALSSPAQTPATINSNAQSSVASSSGTNSQALVSEKTIGNKPIGNPVISAMQKNVTELLYYQNVAEEFATTVYGWKRKDGKPLIEIWKDRLDKARDMARGGKLTKQKLAEEELVIAKEILQTIYGKFGYDENCATLDVILSNKKAQCLGFAQIYYVICRALGYQIYAVATEEPVSTTANGQPASHIRCIICLSDGSSAMVDNRNNRISAFIFGPEVAIGPGTRLEGSYVDGINMVVGNIVLDAKGLTASIYDSIGLLYIKGSQEDKKIAIGYYNEAVRLCPQDINNWQHRAGYYILVNDGDNALADLNKAIEINPKIAAIYGLRGTVFANNFRDYEKAWADFDKAIKLQTLSKSLLKEAYINRGEMAVRLKRYDEAKADFDQAIFTDPSAVLKVNLLCKTYRLPFNYDYVQRMYYMKMMGMHSFFDPLTLGLMFGSAGSAWNLVKDLAMAYPETTAIVAVAGLLLTVRSFLKNSYGMAGKVMAALLAILLPFCAVKAADTEKDRLPSIENIGLRRIFNDAEISSSIKNTVKLLGYGEKVTDDFISMLDDWTDDRGNNELISWRNAVNKAREDLASGLITEDKAAVAELDIAKKIRQEIFLKIKPGKSFRLDTVIKNRRAQCVGNVQLFTVIARAVGLETYGAVSLDTFTDVTLGKGLAEGHITSIVALADGTAVIVDATKEGAFAAVCREEGLKFTPGRRIYIRQSNSLMKKVMALYAIIDLDGISASTWNEFGNLYDRVGQGEEAVRFYSEAITSDPSIPIWFINRATTLLYLGRCDEALADIDTAISLYPDSAHAHYNRGNILINQKRYDEAIVSYSKAIKLNNGYMKAYFNRALTFALLGRFREAGNDFFAAIELDPSQAVMANKVCEEKGYPLRFDLSKKTAFSNYVLDPFSAGLSLAAVGSVWGGIKDIFVDHPAEAIFTAIGTVLSIIFMKWALSNQRSGLKAELKEPKNSSAEVVAGIAAALSYITVFISSIAVSCGVTLLVSDSIRMVLETYHLPGSSSYFDILRLFPMAGILWNAIFWLFGLLCGGVAGCLIVYKVIIHRANKKILLLNGPVTSFSRKRALTPDNIIEAISLEIDKGVNMPRAEWFNLVQSKIPDNMKALRSAMRKIKPLSRRSYNEDRSFDMILKMQERYKLNIKEVEIMTFALLNLYIQKADDSVDIPERPKLSSADNKTARYNDIIDAVYRDMDRSADMTRAEWIDLVRSRVPDEMNSLLMAFQEFELLSDRALPKDQVVWLVKIAENQHRLDPGAAYILTLALLRLSGSCLHARLLPGLKGNIGAAGFGTLGNGEEEGSAVAAVPIGASAGTVNEETRSLFNIVDSAINSNIEMTEEDRLKALIIKRARSATIKKETLIIGLETDWIPGYAEISSLQRQATEPLVSGIKSFVDNLRKKGINIELVHKSRDEIANAVLLEADKLDTDLSNIFILCGFDTANSDSFKFLRSTKALIACIDNTLLLDGATKLGALEVLNEQLIEMLLIVLELETGKEPPYMPGIVKEYNPAKRMLVFLPRILPAGYENMRNINRHRRKLLESA